MIAKGVLGSFVASLFLVLVPLAAATGAVALGVLAAVLWMSVVHGLVARLDGGGEAESRFAVAERARPNGPAGAAGVSRVGTPSP